MTNQDLLLMILSRAREIRRQLHQDPQGFPAWMKAELASLLTQNKYTVTTDVPYGDNLKLDIKATSPAPQLVDAIDVVAVQSDDHTMKEAAIMPQVLTALTQLPQYTDPLCADRWTVGVSVIDQDRDDFGAYVIPPELNSVWGEDTTQLLYVLVAAAQPSAA